MLRRVVTSIALVIVLAAPGPALGGPLDDARRALDARQYDRAARLAEDALAAAPGDGSALFVLGLARFRAKRFAEALQAFDAAGRAASGPAAPLLAYNRASALYELARFEEAERAFLAAAAADPELAPLATLNAGYAARDAGDDARAARHADRAASLPGGAAIADLIADLRSDLVPAAATAEGAPGRTPVTPVETAALAAASAARTTADTTPGERRMDEAITLLRAGNRSAARPALEEAVALGLDRKDRELAVDTIDSLTPGLRSRGRGLGLHAVVGGGFDSLVAQSGIARTEANSQKYDEHGAGFTSATLDLGFRFPLGASGFGELAYGLDQIAYLTDKFADFSLQAHDLSLAVESRIGRMVRLTLGATGQVLFTGLTTFAWFERSATLAPELALDESVGSSTRLSLGYGGKKAFEAADSYYDGTRTDLRLGQDLRVGRGALGLGLRYRNEAVGTEQQDAGELPQLQRRCPMCIGTFVIPYSYKSGAIDLQWQSRVGRLARLGAYASVERRNYVADSYLRVRLPLGGEPETAHRRRKDTRASVGASAGVMFGSAFEATLRWDFIGNRSNIDNTDDEACALRVVGCQVDYDNKNYRKNVITIELSGDW